MGITGDPAGGRGPLHLAAFRGKSHMFEGVVETVQELAQARRLCLVTNGLSRVQRGGLRARASRVLFTAILISEEMGIAKPDREILPRPPVRRWGCRPPNSCASVTAPPPTSPARRRRASTPAGTPRQDGQWPGPGGPPLHVIRSIVDVLRIVPGPVVYP